MKQFDIERYLEGDLSQTEKVAFEQAMQANPVLAKEVALQEQLARDLQIQLVREEVMAAMQEQGEEDGPDKGGNKPWRFLVGFLFLMIPVSYFLLFPKTPAPIEDAAIVSPKIIESGDTREEKKAVPPKSNEEPAKETPTPSVKKQKDKKPAAPVQKNRPIASTEPLPDLRPPLHPSPTLRGQNKEDESHQALLDAVWYTQLPPEQGPFEPPFDKINDLLKERDFTSAYVRLQMQERKTPENDSLAFLKGYCLLEMGEGVEAYNYLSQLKDVPSNWTAYVEWYQALAYLQVKDIQQAVSALKRIRQQDDHPFQKESEKALQLLE